MNIISKILDIPIIWNLSQQVFGCDAQKKRLYRSVFKKTGRVLDFGCADGNTFPAFTDFDYYGVDMNTPLIEYAAKKYKHFHNAHFINADILTKPFEPEFFDYVLFACTGHHLKDEDLYPIMTELEYVLKPGGSIHYFDTIKDPRRQSKLLDFLISMDQGKFMRNFEIYKGMINRFSDRLEPVKYNTLEIKGAFMPQPTYFYCEFVKKY